MSNSVFLQRMQALIRHRIDDKKVIITPKIVANALGIQNDVALQLLEEYRHQNSGELEIVYRAECLDCNTQFDVNDYVKKIRKNEIFSVYCNQCEKDFSAGDDNIFLEYRFIRERARSQSVRPERGSRGGGISLPRRPESLAPSSIPKSKDSSDDRPEKIAMIPPGKRPDIEPNPGGNSSEATDEKLNGEPLATNKGVNDPGSIKGSLHASASVDGHSESAQSRVEKGKRTYAKTETKSRSALGNFLFGKHEVTATEEIEGRIHTEDTRKSKISGRVSILIAVGIFLTIAAIGYFLQKNSVVESEKSRTDSASLELNNRIKLLREIKIIADGTIFMGETAQKCEQDHEFYTHTVLHYGRIISEIANGNSGYIFYEYARKNLSTIVAENNSAILEKNKYSIVKLQSLISANLSDQHIAIPPDAFESMRKSGDITTVVQGFITICSAIRDIHGSLID